MLTFSTLGLLSAILSIYLHIHLTGKNCFLLFAEPIHDATKKDYIILAVLLIGFSSFWVFALSYLMNA